MLRNKRIFLEPVLIFIIVITLGTIILSLSICNNKPITIFDTLFMSVSAVCGNGLANVNVSQQFTIFGQIVIAVLMEISALGFMSIIMYILGIRNKKVGLFRTILASESINESIYSNVKKRAKNICIYSFIIELVGAILLSVRFIPMFGFGKGIWYGIFHSISAFCNCGFDLFGNTSLSYFRNDIYVNLIFMTLILLGGIGFFVLEDILMKKSRFKRMQFQSKIVLTTTGIVLAISIVLIKIMEPKFTLLNSAFTAVTLRTAGFSTVNLSNSNPATKILYSILMFIGGAPGSTSGGIRIVTLTILILTVSSTLRNKRDIVIFNRKINPNYIRRAITIFILSATILLSAIIAFVYLNNFGILNIVFHCASMFSEVGLSLIDVSILNIYGRIITLLLMFIGRVGPITLISLFLIDKKSNENISYPEGNLIL